MNNMLSPSNGIAWKQWLQRQYTWFDRTWRSNISEQQGHRCL